MIRVGAIRGFRHSPMSDRIETARWRLSKPAGGFMMSILPPLYYLFHPPWLSASKGINTLAAVTPMRGGGRLRQ
jgi:hypothetical protein